MTKARDSTFRPEPSPASQQAAWEKAIAGCHDRDDLMTHIAAALIAGRLTPQSVVPKQRTLAKWSGLARETVRLALSELTAMGMINHQGRRSVLTSPAAAPIESGSVLLLTRRVVFYQKHESGYHRQRLRGTEYEVAMHLHDILVAHGIAVATAVADGMSVSAAEAIISARPAVVVLIDWAEDSGVGFGMLARLTKSGVPVVSSSSHYAPPNGDAVDSDHRAAGRMQVRAAHDLGANTILRMWAMHPNQAGIWLPERDAGVVTAAKRAKIALLPPVVLRADEEDVHGGATTVLEWAMVGALACMLRTITSTTPPSRCAVLLSSDGIGVHLTAAYRRLHLDPFPGGHPPIIGCDNTVPNWVAGRPWTPAYSIDRQAQQRAAIMADLVERRLRTPLAAARRVLVAPVMCVPSPLSPPMPPIHVSIAHKKMEVEAHVAPGSQDWA